MSRRPAPAILRPVEPLEDRTAPAAGDLDPTFGEAGRVVLPGSGAAAGAAAHPDGGVVITDAAGVFRLTPDGDLDPTFGSGGRAPLPAGGLAAGRVAVAVDREGRVVVAGGTSLSGRLQFWAARLTPDGRPDPTFGTAGVAVVGFAVDGLDQTCFATAVAVRPDGAVVLAGQVFGGSRGTEFGVARLTAGGTPDPGFGTDGRQVFGFDLGAGDYDEANDVGVLPDGRVVVVGKASRDGGDDWAVARLTADGRLDPGFDDDGRATLRFAGPSSANAVAVQPDGRVVVVGAAGREFGHDLGAARLTAGGDLDPSFGAGGVQTVRVGVNRIGSFSAAAVALQPNGRVVVAGSGGRSAPNARTAPETAAVVVRLTADGRVDIGFGAQGRVVPALEFANGVFVQPGGAVVVTGTVQPAAAGAVRLLGAGPAVVGPVVLAGGPADGSAVRAGGGADPVSFFPGVAVAARVATADVTGDSVPDYIGGAGPGGGPRVVVIDGKTGARVADFFAFEATFAGGVFVAAGDVTGDGRADVVVSPDRGGGPVVAVYDGAGLAAGRTGDAAQLIRYLGINDPDFRGGARPAVGDLTGDGVAEVVVSAGFLGGPRVTVWRGRPVGSAAPVELANFFAFEDTVRNGAFVGAGDFDGDGFADLAVGGGPGGAPRVRVIDGRGLIAAGASGTLDAVAGTAQAADFFAGDPARRGGVRVALTDTDGDGRADLVTGSGEGEPARVRVYLGPAVVGTADPVPAQELVPFGGAALADGVFVG